MCEDLSCSQFEEEWAYPKHERLHLSSETLDSKLSWKSNLEKHAGGSLPLGQN